jgi:YVTN family beta-propeller protein
VIYKVRFLTILAVAVMAGCSSNSGHEASVSHAASPAEQVRDQLPGMPPVLDRNDIYSADRPNALVDAVKAFPHRVYVPNTISNDVYVIDQASMKVIDHFKVGRLPQHVTPSFDMRTLWALNDKGNSLTAIDPMTGKPGKTVPVLDPYNMYYTPDGKYALVVAEQRERLEFYDAGTMKLVKEVWVPCKGVDHMDFSANGRYLIASCEFGGAVIKFDVAEKKLIGRLPLNPHGMPQDVKLSPDGSVFYVADMHSNGVHMIDGESFKELGFIPTGKGAHGLYVSRDSKVMYVSNRGEGTISLIDLKTRMVSKKWEIPGGGSPDMGGVSADGKVLWLSGRFNAEVYAISTSDGKLLARIPVGRGPHGLCVYPQPGRYSLGHTGVFR